MSHISRFPNSIKVDIFHWRVICSSGHWKVDRKLIMSRIIQVMKKSTTSVLIIGQW